MIEKVERFRCERCGYITENLYAIRQIKRTDICPACENGKGRKWELKKEKAK